MDQRLRDHLREKYGIDLVEKGKQNLKYVTRRRRHPVDLTRPRTYNYLRANSGNVQRSREE